MTPIGRFAQPHHRIEPTFRPREVATAETDSLARRILDAKVRLHRKLIDELDLAAIEKAGGGELRRFVAETVSRYVLEERLPVNAGELENLVDELIDEMT